ncbi:DUF4176 domain-containing protein [Streptococcus acidominimus]|uniref:DUF4176 domain-containing protein n=1 Tax=Streptococcus acidominimus TaxID=1326 RepID=A0A4Y9FMW5_STRAI|nr:DUF4176 domain-containing protein [Streptococcus acidominimus]MBF0819050.1 DUF4176 domain-containing protein [Streptococcus acidominimus]MBF0839898.1 DUF4176 domain-containing protein [Streptococcus acidominimus]MBF0845951.1 DUF4176 domain-containing protein [Streptococcus danieliae]TFU30366.1 DUF4176 domain-containing protein [Streptococcus acidominimus]
MNNVQQHLPIGTIVKVKNREFNYMIASLFPVVEVNKVKGYFDFGGVTLPVGVSGQHMFFFNKEEIENVLFIGYIDKSFQDLIANYDQLVSDISYPKHYLQKEKI